MRNSQTLSDDARRNEPERAAAISADELRLFCHRLSLMPRQCLASALAREGLEEMVTEVLCLRDRKFQLQIRQRSSNFSEKGLYSFPRELQCWRSSVAMHARRNILFTGTILDVSLALKSQINSKFDWLS